MPAAGTLIQTITIKKETMITIITQSRRIARTISYILQADIEMDGYFSNDKYFITWTYGHMVEIDTPRGNTGYWFHDTSFPVIPKEYLLKGASSLHSTGRDMPDPQLGVVRNLLAKSNKVIIATDPTAQGVLMSRYLLDYFKFEGKVIRVVLNDLMSDTIKSRLYYPSHDRSFDLSARMVALKDRLDWLTNVNVSRAFAFATGMNTYPISRTALPLLTLVARREKEIREFHPESYHIPTLTFKDNDGNLFPVMCDNMWKSLPQELTETLKPGASAVVVKYETETYDQPSPKLHNIVTLQEKAAELFGMDPVQTYKIARGLYEKKRISFPGTSTDGINRRDYDNFKKDVYPRMLEIPAFKRFSDEGYRPVFTKSGKDEYSVDHGITLTAYPLVGLATEEKKILALIGLRMMETFSRSFRFRRTVVTLECAGQKFSKSYREVIRPGYKIFSNPDCYASTEAPALEVGQSLKVESVGSLTKTTSPPKVYDDASLLADCHDSHYPEFHDGVVKDLMFLQSKGYLRRNLMGEYSLTESGKALCYIVRDMEIADPEGLIRLEQWIYNTAVGNTSEEEYNEFIEKYVTEVTTEVLSCAKLFKPIETDIRCPKCGKGVIRIFGKIAKCTNPECGHSIYRHIDGVTINSREVRNLFVDGHTSPIRGFMDEDGKSFVGRVTFDENFSPVVVNIQKQ